MHLMKMSAEAAKLALGAMKAVAAADGVLERDEAALIRAAAQLVGASVDPAALEPLRPDALRDAGLEPRDAERVVQAAILAALMDGRVEAAEVATVRDLAEAAGVEEWRVHSLSLLARGHISLMWLDLAR